jgi:hypothetical protein
VNICAACEDLLKSKENDQSVTIITCQSMPLRYISNTVTYEEVNTTRISPSKVLSEHQYVLNNKLHASKKQKMKTNDTLNHIDHGYLCTKPKKI